MQRMAKQLICPLPAVEANSLLPPLFNKCAKPVLHTYNQHILYNTNAFVMLLVIVITTINTSKKTMPTNENRRFYILLFDKLHHLFEYFRRNGFTQLCVLTSGAGIAVLIQMV